MRVTAGGVVDEHRQPAETLRGFVHESVARLLVVQIGGDEVCGAARGRDLPRDRVDRAPGCAR